MARRHIETAPQDGSVFYGWARNAYRWKPYKANSAEFRRGIKGRWQKANPYGGFENSDPPTEWEPLPPLAKEETQ